MLWMTVLVSATVMVGCLFLAFNDRRTAPAEAAKAAPRPKVAPTLVAAVAVILVWVLAIRPWHGASPGTVALWSALAAAAGHQWPKISKARRAAKGFAPADYGPLSDLALMFVIMTVTAAVFMVINGVLSGLGQGSAAETDTLKSLRALQTAVAKVAGVIKAGEIGFFVAVVVCVVGYFWLRAGRLAWLQTLLKTHERFAKVRKRFSTTAICIGAFSLTSGGLGASVVGTLIGNAQYRLSVAEGQGAQYQARVTQLLATEAMRQALDADPPALDCGIMNQDGACPADLVENLQYVSRFVFRQADTWPREAAKVGLPAESPARAAGAAARELATELAKNATAPAEARKAPSTGLDDVPLAAVAAAQQAADKAEGSLLRQPLDVPEVTRRAWSQLVADTLFDKAGDLLGQLMETLVPGLKIDLPPVLQQLAELFPDAVMSSFQAEGKAVAADIAKACADDPAACDARTETLLKEALQRPQVTAFGRRLAPRARSRMMDWAAALRGDAAAAQKAADDLNRAAEPAFASDIGHYRDLRRSWARDSDHPSVDLEKRRMVRHMLSEWDAVAAPIAVSMRARGGKMTPAAWDLEFLNFLNSRPDDAAAFAYVLRMEPKPPPPPPHGPLGSIKLMDTGLYGAYQDFATEVRRRNGQGDATDVDKTTTSARDFQDWSEVLLPRPRLHGYDAQGEPLDPLERRPESIRPHEIRMIP